MRVRDVTLFTAFREAGRQFRDLLPRHRIAQAHACRRDLFCVIEMRDRIHDSLRALPRMTALEYSRANEDAIDAQLHAERGVGRSRDASCGKIDYRQSSELCNSKEELRRDTVLDRSFFYFLHLLLFQKFLQLGNPASDRANVPDRLDDISAPCFALGPYHRGAFIEPAHRLTQVARAANEAHGERGLVHVEFLIGGREDLALIDVIHLERLKYLRFGKMSDAALGHHGDGYRLLYFPYHCGVRHSRDAAVSADIRRHALQSHDRHRPRLLGYFRLLGIRDIHDDAAFLHARQSRLQPEGPF